MATNANKHKDMRTRTRSSRYETSGHEEEAQRVNVEPDSMGFGCIGLRGVPRTVDEGMVGSRRRMQLLRVQFPVEKRRIPSGFQYMHGKQK